jgi:hypothetical protein
MVKKSAFVRVNAKPRRKNGTNPHKNQKTQDSDERKARSCNKDGYTDRLIGRILSGDYEFSVLESVKKEARPRERRVERHCEVVVKS